MSLSEQTAQKLIRSNIDLEAAVRDANRLELFRLPQVRWSAKSLMARYDADWAEVKRLWLDHVGRELGDKRAAWASYREVMRVDEALKLARPMARTQGRAAGKEASV